MRIGKFAAQHGVTQDTVRYYMERGLIIAQKQGEQYFFTQEDHRNMELILEWKELGFSLTSVLDLLTIQRLSGEPSDSFRNHYLSSLEHKQAEINQEIEKLAALNRTIIDKIQDHKNTDALEKPLLGFPLSSLNILICPDCKKPLHLSTGSLEHHMVMEASADCSCGYGSRIHQGVFIDEASLRPKLLNDGPLPTKEEYIKSTSHTYINYIYQTIAILAKHLEAVDEPAYILELSNCSGMILMQYINTLSKNTTYILVDHDLDRLMCLKRNLERHHDHKRFMFLATDFTLLPLANGTIDAIADFGMSRKLYKENKTLLPTMMAELLNDNGSFMASSVYFGDNSKGRRDTMDPKGYYTKRWLLEQLDKATLRIIQETSVGPVFQEGASDEDLAEMELFQWVVRSVKSQRKSLN